MVEHISFNSNSYAHQQYPNQVQYMYNGSRNTSAGLKHVPKTLSCVFQPSARSNSSTISQDFYATTNLRQARKKKQSMTREKLIKIESHDYQDDTDTIMSSDRPYEAVETIEDFQQRRSKQKKRVCEMRLQPETIYSEQNDPCLLEQQIINKQKQQLQQYQNIYSLKPVQFESVTSQIQSLSFEVQPSIYEPINHLSSQTMQVPMKDLKGRALSENMRKEQPVVRKLTFEQQHQQQVNEGSKMDHLYKVIREMRDQIAKYETIIDEKQGRIELLENQGTDIKRKLRDLTGQCQSQIENIIAKDDIIAKLNQSLNEVQCGIEAQTKRWDHERKHMLDQQQQITAVCQEQLQGFYDLNKKSQVVIERLEQELAQHKQELERVNSIIHQQHEMYYKLYREHTGLPLEEVQDSGSKLQFEKMMIKQLLEPAAFTPAGRRKSFGCLQQKSAKSSETIKYSTGKKKETPKVRTKSVAFKSEVSRNKYGGKENLYRPIDLISQSFKQQ